MLLLHMDPVCFGRTEERGAFVSQVRGGTGPVQEVPLGPAVEKEEEKATAGL